VAILLARLGVPLSWPVADRNDTAGRRVRAGLDDLAVAARVRDCERCHRHRVLLCAGRRAGLVWLTPGSIFATVATPP